MKTRYFMAIFLSVVCMFAWADDPDDSGIGGTGRGDAPEVDFFESPDVLESLDIPLPTDDIPGLSDMEIIDGDEFEGDVETGTANE